MVGTDFHKIYVSRITKQARRGRSQGTAVVNSIVLRLPGTVDRSTTVHERAMIDCNIFLNLDH